MRHILRPRALTTCQTAAGHPVRVVSATDFDESVKVVSLRTGLRFTTTRADLFEKGSK